MADGEIRWFGCKTKQEGDSTRKVRDDMLNYSRGYTTERWANIDLDKKTVRFDQTCSGRQHIDRRR
jgi:hypothetical protein